MKQIPDAFNALAVYDQWVIWMATPDEAKPGKIKKTTVNPLTLLPHDAHDPTIQYSAADALHIASTLPDNYNVGFVFTENDPFWFFDLDNCTTPDDKWNDETLAFCEYFKGASVEVSVSGRGLHIIGSGVASIGPHGTNNNDIGHQFYTHKRFVALTGTGVTGDAGFDASHILPQFAAYYFPPKHVGTDAKWTTEPDLNSRPIKSDKALIKKMLDSGGAAVVFGDKVGVRDLWTANAEKLATAYPSFSAADPYDRSSADQALCNHLAFWTGKDCARMESLFEQSALLRDKWTKRKQYRQDTILKACRDCGELYGAQKAAKEAARVEWQPDTAVASVDIVIKGGASIVTYPERATFFNGHYYLTKQGRVFCPDGVIRNQSDYNSMFSTAEFAEQFGGKPLTKAWDAYITAVDITRAEVYDVAYRPQYPYGVAFGEDGRNYVNDYCNRDGVRIDGDATPFIDHLNTILPNGRDVEILLSWMAAFIQYPGKKFTWSPFIQGCEGNGKSIMTRVLAYCVGVDHVEDVDSEDFCNSGGKFNGYIRNHRLATLEEIHTGSRNQAESALKRFIGNDRLQMQSKGVDQLTIKTCINWLIYSNHKDAVKVSDTSRRFAMLFTAQQEYSDLMANDMQRGGKYFTKLFDWFYKQDGWGKVAHMLATYAIPAEFNPAGDADKAPETTSFVEAVNECKTVPHQAVIDILTSGRPGTLKGWASITMLRKTLSKDYGLRSPSGKMLATYLKAEGYKKHPALKNNGRTTRNIFQEDCQRSVLYVKSDSIQAVNMIDAQLVTDQYMRDQGYQGMPPAQGQEVQQ